MRRMREGLGASKLPGAVNGKHANIVKIDMRESNVVVQWTARFPGVR